MEVLKVIWFILKIDAVYESGNHSIDFPNDEIMCQKMSSQINQFVKAGASPLKIKRLLVDDGFDESSLPSIQLICKMNFFFKLLLI